jgi:hypothetical protein
VCVGTAMASIPSQIGYWHLSKKLPSHFSMAFIQQHCIELPNATKIEAKFQDG